MSIDQIILVFLIGLSAGATTSLTGASAVMITVPIEFVAAFLNVAINLN